jgi:acetolactate synthase-1/2/3 large subunit
MTKLATLAGQVLADEGVRVAFGVVGNGNFLAVAGLMAGGVRYVAARHEGGAIAMADAYYRATGDVAVCTTTYGPGLTNAATGLAEAVKHRSGVLLLSGDQPTSGPRPIDIDQGAFAAALGARTIRVTDPATVRDTVARALELARDGPRLVVLSLAADLLGADVPDQPGQPPCPDVAQIRPRPGLRRAPAARQVDAALDVLASARRPLLLAGLGAYRSGAAQPIAALADLLGALLTTTVMVDGLYRDSPWCLGICGGFASPRAARIMGDADVIVAFGASLNDFTLHGGRLLDPGATLVQVDLDGAPTVSRVDLCVTGDASRVAGVLLEGVRARGLMASSWRDQVTADIGLAGWEHEPYDDASTASQIDPRSLSLALVGLLPAKRTLVMDGGHFVGWPAMYWPAADPSALVFTGAAFQTIGLGFAGAVGAAVGRKDRTTVVALGDGGALMGLPELETLIRVSRSALVVIFNDSAYGAEIHMYRPLRIDTSPATFVDTDFAAVARSFGAQAATVRTVADLAGLRAWREAGCHGTYLLDCKVVPDVVAKYLTNDPREGALTMSTTSAGQPVATQTERVPLSLNQEFVCLFDSGGEDGPFGPHYHIVEAWRVSGQVDAVAMRRALRNVVERHEALRTVIVRDGDDKYQEIYPASTPELSVRDITPEPGKSRDQQAEELIRELENGEIEADQPPLIKAVLARFDDQDSVLALMTHHIATDGWSVRVIIRDLVNRYAAQLGLDIPELPEAPQYREFAAWSREAPDAQPAAAIEYWRKTLSGALISALPTDFARSAGVPHSTGAYRFSIPADLASAATKMAAESRSTTAIVLLAAYQVVVQRKLGSKDVIVATFTPGRGGRLFEDTVGSFFNFIPLRTELTGCATFREVLDRTRRTCLDAYSRDIPSIHIFGLAPELMGPAMTDNAAAAVFQVFPDPVMLADNIPGDLKVVEISREPRGQERTSAMPDGMLWTLSTAPSGDMIGVITFKRNIFSDATIGAMAEEFLQVLRQALSLPDAPLQLG